MKTTLFLLLLSVNTYAQIVTHDEWQAYTQEGKLTKYRMSIDFNDELNNLDDTLQLRLWSNEIYRGPASFSFNGADTILQLYFDQSTGVLCQDTSTIERYAVKISYGGQLWRSHYAVQPSQCTEVDSIFDRLIWASTSWEVPDSVFKDEIVVPIDTTDTSIIKGVTDFSESNFSIYPNPSNGVFTVESKELGVAKFYDLSGRLVKSQALKVGINQVEINETGIYFGVVREEKFKVVVR